MIEIRSVTDLFWYYRGYLLIVAIAGFFIGISKNDQRAYKQALGAECAVIIITILNIVVLTSQLGPAIMWDCGIGLIAILSFVVLAKRARSSSSYEKKYVYLPFLAVTFWVIALPYLLTYPSFLKPLH